MTWWRFIASTNEAAAARLAPRRSSLMTSSRISEEVPPLTHRARATLGLPSMTEALTDLEDVAFWVAEVAPVTL